MSTRSSHSGPLKATTYPPLHHHRQPAGSSSSSSSLDAHHRRALAPRQFLDRYSLPRVVRVVAEGGAEVFSREEAQPLRQPLLLYRHYASAKVTATSLAPGKAHKPQGPALVIPSSYQGWFSKVTSKGQPTAHCYSSIQQLVTAQITAFVSRTELTAYKLNDSKDGSTQGLPNRKLQYIKTTIRAGQIIKLLAVFEDVNNAPIPNNKRLSIPLIGRATNKGDKYAQCLYDKTQTVFIPVLTTGQFYAVTGTDENAIVYQLSKILKDSKLPLRVHLMSGPLPTPLPLGFTGNLLLQGCQQEDVILSCTLPQDADILPHYPQPPPVPRFLEIDTDSQFLLTRPIFHQELETRLFKSPLLQSCLAYCRDHGDNWRRQIKVTHHIFPSVNKQKPEKYKTRQATKKSASFTYTPSNPNPPQEKPTTISTPNVPPTVPVRNNVNNELSSSPIQCHKDSSKQNVKDTSSPLTTSVNTQQVKPLISNRQSQKHYSPTKQNIQNRELPSIFMLQADDVPYSKVADAIVNKGSTKRSDEQSDEENIYAEICEPKCTKSKRPHNRLGYYFFKSRCVDTTKDDYYYVQLEGGSDGTFSNTMSSSNPSSPDDEVTYDTVC